MKTLYAVIGSENDDGDLVGVYQTPELAHAVVEYGYRTWRVEEIQLDVVPQGVQLSINRAIARLTALVPRE